MLKDKQPAPKPSIEPPRFFSFLSYWKTSPTKYKRLVIGLLLFTLFNSSDVFLLLKARQAGMNDQNVIMVYIFYNLVYALFAFPLGALADNVGLKRMFIVGLMVFSIVYGGMASATDKYLIYGLFFLYGIYAAATEGVSKAWISNLMDNKDTATAIGTFTAFQSICTMLASSMAGLLWYYYGANITFWSTAAAALLLLFYFARVVDE